MKHQTATTTATPTKTPETAKSSSGATSMPEHRRTQTQHPLIASDDRDVGVVSPTPVAWHHDRWGRSDGRRDTDEWYSPIALTRFAHRWMGGIDLDPASTSTANAAVNATWWYEKHEDGLSKPWAGKRIWLNPPWSNRSLGPWIDRLLSEDLPKWTALVSANLANQHIRRLIEEATTSLIVLPQPQYWRPDGSQTTGWFASMVSCGGASADPAHIASHAPADWFSLHGSRTGRRFWCDDHA